ncbi:ABC-type transport auxiliary lipoprotein family protein [Pseudoroseomonas cervicalis]|uniref:ABC-type transport auxiliary lipoprotein family protein n=1 Tax=Teichococcus cervicalis TaxID=204525 RepID=UPI0022F16353|nr:ABC-type transport auxiliary lipoprotein family protein [Pseudoroseomonas cervicalis]WBV44059.1 ABC-type transport auxiliary lipoprotein family protein [Pseudoroseomonas cervicalis]
MSRTTRRALLVLAPLGLAACSVLPDRPYVEVRRFPLAPPPPPATGGRGRRVLLLRLMRAAPGQEARGLRSLREDGTEQVDYYAEWSAPPAELAEEAMRRWLAGSGLFSAVVAPGSRAAADLTLETELTALLADLGRGEARAGLSAVLLREGGEGSQVLTQLAVTGTAPLPAARPLRPEALAAAMNEAFAAALGALERGIARYA